jgi:DNA-binding response OmpR family regulator
VPALGSFDPWFAADPVRVFSKHQLARCIWRCEISGRTVESHVARLRTRLAGAGAHDVLINLGATAGR